MRQAVFAVLLLAAAFLGGALVNGPALRWAQDALVNYLGPKDGGEIASIEPPRSPGETAATDKAPPAVADRIGKSSAGVTADRKSGKPAADAASGTATANPGSPRRKAPGADAGPASANAATLASRGRDESPHPLTTPSPVPEPAAPAPIAAANAGPKAGRDAEATAGRASSSPSAPGLEPPLDAPEPGPAPLDPSVGKALLASFSPSPSSSPSPSVSPSPAHPSPAELGSRREPDSIPLEVAPAREAAAAESAPAPPTSASATATTAPGGPPAGDWAALRRKMQRLGVTRYTIEGEPGGRVRFSCLIPLAGRQAVSQRFEAEADDEVQAAGLALRRIALWRAARPANAPAP